MDFVSEKIHGQARSMCTLGAEAECRTENETDEDACDTPGPQSVN
jgi:hypothetical protein